MGLPHAAYGAVVSSNTLLFPTDVFFLDESLLVRTNTKWNNHKKGPAISRKPL